MLDDGHAIARIATRMELNYRSYLHWKNAMQPKLLLTHGAGSNREAPLLVALDAEFTSLGFSVERIDLAFRRNHTGPPRPADSANDRADLALHLERLRALGEGPLYLGGHSYGGRQGSMLLAENPTLADGLLLLAYPLHPPGKPAQLRTAHFPTLRTPVLFASGGKDEFGTEEELRLAMEAIPAARKELLVFPKLRHDLGGGRKGVATEIAAAFHSFANPGPSRVTQEA